MPRDGLAAIIDRAEGCSVVFAGATPDGAEVMRPDVAILEVHSLAQPIDDAVHQLVKAGVRVLLTGDRGVSARILAGMDAGALGFVSTDTSTAELLAALTLVGQGTMHVTPELAVLLTSPAQGPGLSPREVEVVRLFATGMKLAAVARHIGVSTHTAKEYLDRARRKYADVGRPARTRTELYIAAVADGLIPGADSG